MPLHKFNSTQVEWKIIADVILNFKLKRSKGLIRHVWSKSEDDFFKIYFKSNMITQRF